MLAEEGHRHIDDALAILASTAAVAGIAFAILHAAAAVKAAILITGAVAAAGDFAAWEEEEQDEDVTGCCSKSS